MERSPYFWMQALLLTILGPDQIRQRIRFLNGGERIAAELPSASISAQAVVAEAIDALHRHARMGEFLAMLEQDFPLRRHEIQFIKELWVRVQGKSDVNALRLASAMLALTRRRESYTSAIEENEALLPFY